MQNNKYNFIILGSIATACGYIAARLFMESQATHPKDINSLEMYLSEYVGHSHYAADDYYQHLTASFYPEMEKRMSVVNRNILPEVPHEK